MRRLWLLFLAFFHLSDRAVCEASKGPMDFHDYPDDVLGFPDHVVELTCKRCGKTFWL